MNLQAYKKLVSLMVRGRVRGGAHSSCHLGFSISTNGGRVRGGTHSSCHLGFSISTKRGGSEGAQTLPVIWDSVFLLRGEGQRGHTLFLSFGI